MNKGTEIATVKSLLRREDYQNRFKEILGARAAQFSASVVNVSRDQNIAACDPASVIAAAIVAATLDLPVDKNLGFAWIVPYKNVASFQMGYKGYVQLALRTGQYERMNATPINAEAYGGRDSVGEPVILWEKIDTNKPVVGYAFAWKLVTGFTKVCYWPKERVEAHARQYSQSYRGNYSSPWKTHFDQMAIKTVIKNELSDWGILSIELQKALRHDQGSQVDIESEVVYVDNGGETGSKPADLSDLGPQKPPGSPVAKPGNVVPMSAPTDGKASPAPATAPAAPTAEAPAICKYCGEAVQDMANHDCEGMRAALAATAKEPPADADGIIAELLRLGKESGVDEALIVQFCVANKLAKPEQKQLRQLSTAKLTNLLKSWDTIESEIVKLKPATP